MRIADTDYIAFRDAVIVALADDQEPPGLGDLDLFDLCERHQIGFLDTWVMTVGKDMEGLGWGEDTSTLDAKRFLINGGGLARAAEVRNARKSRSLINQVRAVPRSDWISLMALIVSAIALFKGS